VIITTAIVETPTLEGTVVRMWELGTEGHAVSEITLDERDWLNVADRAGGLVSYPPQRIVCVFWSEPA
jgi:hypothetical protein